MERGDRKQGRVVSKVIMLTSVSMFTLRNHNANAEYLFFYCC